MTHSHGVFQRNKIHEMTIVVWLSGGRVGKSFEDSSFFKDHFVKQRGWNEMTF